MWSLGKLWRSFSNFVSGLGDLGDFFWNITCSHFFSPCFIFAVSKWTCGHEHVVTNVSQSNRDNFIAIIPGTRSDVLHEEMWLRRGCTRSSKKNTDLESQLIYFRTCLVMGFDYIEKKVLRRSLELSFERSIRLRLATSSNPLAHCQARSSLPTNDYHCHVYYAAWSSYAVPVVSSTMWLRAVSSDQTFSYLVKSSVISGCSRILLRFGPCP
jgi:hypothetical protein